MLGHTEGLGRFDGALGASSLLEDETPIKSERESKLKDAVLAKDMARLAHRVAVDHQRTVRLLIVVHCDEFVVLVRIKHPGRRTSAHQAWQQQEV